MRFQTALCFATLALGLLLSGCSNARTMEGTWVSEGQAATTVTVTGDTFKQSSTVMGTSFSVAGKGSYDDKAGVLTVSELKLDAPGAPPQLLSAAAANLPKEATINVSWTNADEIVLTASNPGQVGASGTFKRQKQ